MAKFAFIIGWALSLSFRFLTVAFHDLTASIFNLRNQMGIAHHHRWQRFHRPKAFEEVGRAPWSQGYSERICPHCPMLGQVPVIKDSDPGPTHWLSLQVQRDSELGTLERVGLPRMPYSYQLYNRRRPWSRVQFFIGWCVGYSWTINDQGFNGRTRTSNLGES